jgi:hypothetical protein
MAARRRRIALALAAGALGLAVLAYRQGRLPPASPPPGVRPSAVDAQGEPPPGLAVGDGAPPGCTDDGVRDARPAVDADAREQQATTALRAIARELAASAAAADRAAGLYRQLVDAQRDARRQFAGRNPQCATDDTCGGREDAALMQAARPIRDALARLAAASNEVPAYHLAYLACGAVDTAADKGECAQLSARQWTRLEPDNALAWLFAAGEAARQAQPALADEALYRAAHAPRLDSHWSTFARLLDAHAVRNADEDARAAVTTDVVGMAAATRFAPFQPLFDYCSAQALADVNRHQVCDDLARMLTERSDEGVSLVVGAKLAQALGWPQDQIDAVQDRRDAYYQVIWDSAARAPQRPAGRSPGAGYRWRNWRGNAAPRCTARCPTPTRAARKPRRCRPRRRPARGPRVPRPPGHAASSPCARPAFPAAGRHGSAPRGRARR